MEHKPLVISCKLMKFDTFCAEKFEFFINVENFLDYRNLDKISSEVISPKKLWKLEMIVNPNHQKFIDLDYCFKLTNKIITNGKYDLRASTSLIENEKSIINRCSTKTSTERMGSNVAQINEQVSHSQFNLKNKCLTIKVKVEIIEQLGEFRIIKNTQPFMFLVKEKLKATINSPGFKHKLVTVIVEEERFEVHQAVLTCWSSVFEKMFNINMSESETGTVTLTKIEPGIFELLLKFMSKGIFPNDLDATIFMKLFGAAHRYQIEEITAQCELELELHVTTENALEFYEWAWLYDLKKGSKEKIWKIINQRTLRLFIEREELPTPDEIQQMIDEDEFMEKLKIK